MNAPERIAFDARYVNDRYHGIGRYAFQLLEALVLAQGDEPAIDVQERTFVVFRGQGHDSRFDWEMLAARPNVEIWDGPWPLYWPQEQLLWPLLLRRSRVDLFHSPYFVAPLLAPCPVVITVHDLIFDRYRDYMPRAWSWPYYRLLMALSTRRARSIIAVSRATAADLARFYQTPSDKLTVALEGADPTFSLAIDGQRQQALRQRYDLARPFVLSVGARRPHKNLARLVRAFASLVPDMPHDLIFVGQADGRFPDQARQAAEALGLNGRVRFLDWVPEADLPALYALANLVAVPSIVEGFGLPTLEAMASGTPVLAANTSSLPEVVGSAGVLVDPYDERALAVAIRDLLNDETLRRRLAEAGRARAATFTWEKVARQVSRVYSEALR